jgi:hypothetical protein
MIYKGTDIVGRARLILMDAGAKAWTDIELYGWLNDGRSVLYQLRPDIFTEDGEMTLVAGTRQTVPDQSDRLFTIEHNVSHKDKRTISLTTDQVLDRFRPQWRTKKQSTEIEHYLYAEAGGTDYEVYPPAVVGVKVWGSWAKPPAALTVGSTVDLDAEGELATAYIDYVLARAFQKESTSAPSFVELSKTHFALFNMATASDAQTKLTLSPNMQRDGGEPPKVSA